MTQSCKVQRDQNQFYWRLDTWGLLALGVVGLDFCLGCIPYRGSWLCVYFIWNVGLLSVFGGTWFVVCIACKCVIELWLVLWRDQYIYLFIKWKKKKNHYNTSWWLSLSCFGPFWVWGMTLSLSLPSFYYFFLFSFSSPNYLSSLSLASFLLSSFNNSRNITFLTSFSGPYRLKHV